ncbi:MAG: GNAT family N-acetyltransferase [Colwellia sp.]|nr:GNAT family N-acetyltransferase [Colwellia sp.]
MIIKIDNLDGIEVKQLLQEHHDDMLKHSPPESVHALDLSSLKLPEVTFWTAWISGQLAGCGALKQLDEKHVELKSMRTAQQFLRKGVAANILQHMLTTAKEQSFEKVSLETGTMDAFVPAQKLYKRFGFRECKPFADYQEDPYSMFLEKTFK